jgi:hypothetical protein
MPYKNKIEQQQAQRRHYEQNKDEYRDSNARQRERRRNWFTKMTMDLSCSCCPENSFAVLDFHHLDSTKKDRNVSMLLNNKRSLDRVVNEMKKCVVLCANCHRKHHAGILDLPKEIKTYEPPKDWENFWSGMWESNPRPLHSERSTLPA